MHHIILAIVLVTVAGLYYMLQVPRGLVHLPRVPLHITLLQMLWGTPFDEQVQQYQELIQKHKVVAMFSMGRWVVVTSCLDATHTVFTEPHHFPRLNVAEVLPHLLIAKFMGHNIATSNGEVYMRHRRVVGPAFRAPIALPKMTPTITQLITALAPPTSSSSPFQPIQVLPLIQRTAVNILGKVILGVNFDMFSQNSQSSSPPRFITAYNTIIRGSFSPLFVLCPSLDAQWNPLRRHLHLELAYLDQYFQSIYQARLAEINQHIEGTGEGGEGEGEGKGSRDILSLMIKASIDEGLKFTVQELKFNVMGLFTAGHDTTAASVCAALYLLACHRDTIQNKLRHELAPFFLNNNKNDNNDDKRMVQLADHLESMPLLQAVILETLRLYPSVARQFPRISQCDNWSIAGHAVPKGTYVLIDTMSIHRNPDHWPNPERFDPYRFMNLGDNNSNSNYPQRPALSWSPFLGGVHHCIGKKFALTQQKLILAGILSTYDVQLPPSLTSQDNELAASASSNYNLPLGSAFLLDPSQLELLFVPLNPPPQSSSSPPPNYAA